MIYLIAHLAHAEQHLMELEGETKWYNLLQNYKGPIGYEATAVWTIFF